MVSMEPDAARTDWRALLDNATALIRDAHALHDIGSFGRVRALTVLAEEELGKATAVYALFSAAWSEGNNEARDLPTESSRFHLAKYAAAYEFGAELDAFWGGGYGEHLPETEDWAEWSADDWKRWQAEKEAEALSAARIANREKQQGFYVDLDGDSLSRPDRFAEEHVGDQLVRAAQVIEMMLIKDHTRMQDLDPTRFDDTGAMQWSLLPTSHGDEWADWVARGAPGEPPEAGQ